MKVEISEELLDQMVNALSHLPYRDVQGIFLQLGQELAPPREEQPQIHVPH